MNAAILCQSAVNICFNVPTASTRVEVTVERDKRTMNNMDSETKAAHIRLEMWGLETRDQLNGYPTQTLLGRLITQGPMGAPQQGRPPVELSRASQIADACVARLCQIDQKCLRLYYGEQMSSETLAQRMGGRMRVRQAQNVLRRARWRFMAHLAVVEG